MRKLEKFNPVNLFTSLCILFFIPLQNAYAMGASPNDGSTGFGAVGTSLGFASAKWTGGLQYLGMLIGLGLAVMGVVTMVKSRNSHSGGGAGMGVALLLGGVALTSLSALLTSGSQSMFGTMSTETLLQTIATP